MESLSVWVNLGLILLFVAGNAFFVGSGMDGHPGRSVRGSVVNHQDFGIGHTLVNAANGFPDRPGLIINWNYN